MNLIDLLSIEEVNKYVEYKTYEKNQVIFSQGVECNFIGVIISGNVYISTITYNYKEEILNNLTKDDTFATSLIFSSTPYFLGTVISLTKAKIAFISKSNLIKLLSSNRLFLEQFLRITSDNLITLKNRNKLLNHKNITDRILYYFDNELKTKGEIRIKSIADLARILSIPRPSLSRELSKLIKNKQIEINNKIISLK